MPCACTHVSRVAGEAPNERLEAHTELKEHGLHHLEQRGLRKGVNGTAVYKHEPFLQEEENNCCSGPLG